MIRVATPLDEVPIGALLLASYSYFYKGWYRDDLLKVAMPDMTRPRPELLASGTYYAYERKERMIACGGWSKNDPLGLRNGAHICHIRHFATHHEYIGSGAGSALIGRCITSGKSEGITEFDCLSSLTAEAFYASRGFSHIKPIEVPMGGAKFTCILMRLIL